MMTSPKIAVRAFRADPATTAPTTTASATPARAGFTASGSWAGGRQLRRVGGRREDPEGVERPVAQPGSADDLRNGHRPERARVLGIRPVIAHQEQVTLRHDPAVLVALNGRRLRRCGGRFGIEVRLVDLGVVDEDMAVTDVHGVAAEPDDTLDEGRVVLLDPVGRGSEHDDIAPLVGIEARRQLVDQDVLLGFQRVLHRLLLDLVRLGDERLDDEEDDEGESERLRDLEETPEHGSSGHKTRSIGAGPRGPPEAVGPMHNGVAERV